jgi:glycosyltransferase involved in cell wall biosynthesis
MSEESEGIEGIEISVIIAAYNEEPVIAENIKRVVREMEQRPAVRWELLCVDDGSADLTGGIMAQAAAADPRIRSYHHRRNFGQGQALRTGFAKCRGGTIVTLDADLSYGPEYIYQLVDALDRERAEIALASPYTKGGTVRNVPFYRHFLSRMGNLYLARMSHYNISTSTCVVRAYRREVLDSVALTANGMELQLEVLMKASMMGFRVTEVPAHLEWADDKVAGADLRRVSKMRILNTIRLYLLMGWLSRPALLFVLLASTSLLLGGYMAVVLSFRFFQEFVAQLDHGVAAAVSLALEGIFRNDTYSVVFSSIFLLFGTQLLAFSLLMLQNKFYFEEIYRLTQRLLQSEYAPLRAPPVIVEGEGTAAAQPRLP